MGNRAWDMITVRNQMQDAMEPQFGNYQKNVLDPLMKSFADYGTAAQGKADAALSGISGDYDALMGGYDKFVSGTVDPLKNQMMSLMTDESKRGYSEDVQNAMYGKQAEALTGAKSSFIKNMGKTLASQGLGDAMGGSRNRMMKEYESQHAGRLREASRDVKLADAEAKRADLWNAVQGYGQAAGLEGSALQGKGSAVSGKAGATASLINTGINAGLNALQGQGQVAGMGAQNIRDQLNYWGEKASQSQAYSGVKNQESGFWKSFKNSLGGTLGAGIGQYFSPGNIAAALG